MSEFRQDWRLTVVTLPILLLFVLGLYGETSLYLLRVWSQMDGDYAHGFLVLAISFYLIYENRRVLERQQPCSSLFALLAIILSSLLWFSATIAGVQMVQTISLLMMVFSVAWVVVGNQLIRYLAFPIIFIIFALPIWAPLSPLLQEITADVVFWLSRVIRIPAFRQENHIIIPSGTLSIEEACSGLRYLLAALMLSVLYAYQNYQTLKSRLIVVAIAVAAAIFANILRVLIIVYLAYKTDMQHPLVSDHLTLGWILFGVVLFALLVVDVQIHKRRKKGGDDAEPEMSASDETENEKEIAPKLCRSSVPVLTMILAAAVILASAGPVLAYWAQNQSVSVDTISLNMPIGRDAWVGPLEGDKQWNPVYHGAVSEQRLYRGNEHIVYLYLGYYPVQTQGNEVISEVNRVSDEKIWKMVYPHGRKRSIAGQVVLEQILKSPSGRQRLVWYWYYVAGNRTGNKYEAKVFQVLGWLTGEPQAAVVAISTPFEENIETARMILSEFSSSMDGSFEQLAGGETVLQ
jgi:exosortase A